MGDGTMTLCLSVWLAGNPVTGNRGEEAAHDSRATCCSSAPVFHESEEVEDWMFRWLSPGWSVPFGYAILLIHDPSPVFDLSDHFTRIPSVEALIQIGGSAIGASERTPPGGSYGNIVEIGIEIIGGIWRKISYGF